MTLDVVIPVLNEEDALQSSLTRLHAFMTTQMEDYEWTIVIADNGSTDRTPEVSRSLSREFLRVQYHRIEDRGRGRALKAAWLESDSDVVVYMDVDLSTDLKTLPALVSSIAIEGYDVAIGSRLKKGATVVGRTLLREAISRVYNSIVFSLFFVSFRDAQCGFKALSREAANSLLPVVQDTGWFFDTELLILAEKNGFRIKEIPVHWVDDPDSRVRILNTAFEDLKGLLRLRLGGLHSARKKLQERP